MRIVAALMGLLPPARRTDLTFATEEFGRKPSARRLTFDCRPLTGPVLIWEEGWMQGVSTPVVAAYAAELGILFARGGLAAVAEAIARPGGLRRTVGSLESL